MEATINIITNQELREQVLLSSGVKGRDCDKFSVRSQPVDSCIQRLAFLLLKPICAMICAVMGKYTPHSIQLTRLEVRHLASA